MEIREVLQLLAGSFNDVFERATHVVQGVSVGCLNA